MQNLLPSSALITISESFVKPHLDYGGTLYDQAYMSFHQKLESIQYNAWPLLVLYEVPLKENFIKNWV